MTKNCVFIVTLKHDLLMKYFIEGKLQFIFFLLRLYQSYIFLSHYKGELFPHITDKLTGISNGTLIVKLSYCKGSTSLASFMLH